MHNGQVNAPDMPNFFVPGAAKSGTFSLYFYLKQHPEVCIPRKEMGFFANEMFEQQVPRPKGILIEQEYRRMYRRGTTARTRARGDLTPDYLYHHRNVIPKILSYVGDARIIILLRDPVDRAYSGYTHFLVRGIETLSFEEAIRAEGTRMRNQDRSLIYYVDMGFYYGQVKAYLDSFSAVRVYLLEDLKRDAKGMMREIYEFLEVDVSFVPDTTRIFNTSGIPKNTLIYKMFFKETPFRIAVKEFLVKSFVPERTMQYLIDKFRRPHLHSTPIKPDTRAKLKQLYREDILRLQDLIARDLSSWLE